MNAEERSQEKLFKEWLTHCHRSLDKVTRFEKIGGKELQVELLNIKLGSHLAARYLGSIKEILLLNSGRGREAGRAPQLCV